VDRPVSEPSGSPHRLVNPPSLLAPSGFSHAVVPAAGRTVYLGGQAGHRPDGSLPAGLVDQFDRALANVVEALRGAGGRPEHLVSIQIYVTDAAAYRSALGPIGQAWRRHLGRHYPATSLFEVSALFDPAALVELVCTAVVPDA
jgi:enamine deaminase RidA (YjgF/YER057c/UK114 family)